MYNEAKGLLEVEYSAILSLVGANQPLSYPVLLNNCIVLLVEPSPFPLASLRDLSLASVPFIPKLEPDFNSLIPQQSFFFLLSSKVYFSFKSSVNMSVSYQVKGQSLYHLYMFNF